MTTNSNSSWKEEYLSALNERSQIEKANQSLIDPYTRLADRLSTHQSSPPPSTPTSTSTNETPHLRASLASALRTSTHHQTLHLATAAQLTQLTHTHAALAAELAAVRAENTALQRKLRDREEELRGKGRLVEAVQDEMVVLGLQLNLSERRAEEVGRENRMLVERWMRRIGREADELNEATSGGGG